MKAKTFEQKVRALRKVGYNWTIEDNEQLEYELRYLKDSDPDKYHEFLDILNMIK